MNVSKLTLHVLLRGVIAFVGVSLLGVAHPLWENIYGARYTLLDGSHSRPRG